MALMQCEFFSEVLGLSVSMNVILPQQTRSQIGMEGVSGSGKHPVLWLLHGLSDDHTIWCRRTSIERYAAEYGLAVVMPAGDRSFYCDMAYGGKYFTYISQELPALARSFFPLSDKREDNFVAGLSMGGYGALKLALTYPERYAAACSLSGCTNIMCLFDRLGGDSLTKPIFGDKDPRNTPDDLFWLLRQDVEAGKELPELYSWCGTEDFLFEDNQKFAALCKELNVDLRYTTEPGTHEWGFWDRNIQNFLKAMPLKK